MLNMRLLKSFSTKKRQHYFRDLHGWTLVASSLYNTHRIAI